MQVQMVKAASLKAICILVTSISAALACAQGGHLTVHVDKPAFKVSLVFYGLMTEEINHAYDGGLYGELIQNRAFKDSAESPVHWSAIQYGGSGTIALDSVSPRPGVSWTALKIEVPAPGGPIGVANDGYWGIPVTPNTHYRASFYARAAQASTWPVHVDIESTDGQTVFASGEVRSIGSDWHKYTVDLHTGAVPASKNNRFVISTKMAGTLWLAQVSLFPPTYKNRPNGNRIDLMQELAKMNPSFLRLPGGNYLEGDTIPERFEWKDTIGDPAMRPGHQGPWRYRSSDGLGLLEFLEWCEDLHMQPVLAVYAGYSLRGDHVSPGADLKPYVDDALDEIEYVTGDVSTKWGAVRAQNGHPKPFPLTYVEIGNEDGFDRSGSYNGRFGQFYDAIKAKYPQLQLIATMPVTSRKADVLDDHYYRPASAMERDADHYDHISRNGPKIFVGEWASVEGRPTPTFQAALGDAAWLTGLERNSDLVVMESYAPLLVNMNRNAAQWPTNLIGYDALGSFGSPSFYVQSMFGKNTGDQELPVDLFQVSDAAPVFLPHGAIGVGTYRTQAEYKDIEVTNGEQKLFDSNNQVANSGWTFVQGTWGLNGNTIQQTSMRQNARATAGEVRWTNYTIRAKARKTSGLEGFMVLFHVQDQANYWQWNVGGWNDTQSQIQRTEDGSADGIGEPSDAMIETGRWYDLRVEVNNGHIKCYLDGKLVNEATETVRPPIQPLYACASKVSKGGDVILKVVNVSKEAQKVQIDLAGVRQVGPKATVWELTGQPDDQNSVEQPKKVAPKAVTFTGAAPSFSYTFPALSVTVLRVKART